MVTWNFSFAPRTYQTKAADWALEKRQGVCCLPTGTGKTLVAVLWLKFLFESEEVNKALILEPTRLLVNQTTEYFLQKANAECIPIDGRIPKDKRRELWASAEIVVAIPETVFNDIEDVNMDAIVVDECHHTVGQDACAKVMANLEPEWRLGLSAFVPERREEEIKHLIGPIRRWSWSDREIAPFVPNWIGEIYEGHLDPNEQVLLGAIRRLPIEPGLNPGLLERYLTRDGSTAVKETLTKKNRLAEAFGEMLLPMVPNNMHKLEAVREVVNTHEPHKAIVFVDRVVIADRVSALLSQMKPVVFKGKSGRFNQSTALNQAHHKDTRLVVSTSAGEEGIDLPSADLLVIWGNAASDIRFIQRLGRMMRKTGEGLKFATFVVTPESSDFNSFVEGLSKAAAAGTIDVEKTFGWDPEVLWPETTWWHVSKLLRQNPKPLKEMADTLEVREELAEKVIAKTVRKGRLFYIYDVEGIVREAEAERDRWTKGYTKVFSEATWTDSEWFRKAAWNTAISMMGRTRQYRIYALTDDVCSLKQQYSSQFSHQDCKMILEVQHRQSQAKRGRGSHYTVLRGAGPLVSPADNLWGTAVSLAKNPDLQSIALRRRKSERLIYYFQPQSEETLRAVVENAARLFELIDHHCGVNYARFGGVHD